MTGYPTTLTLMGLGALPSTDPHFLGMLGMHGTYEANLTMYHCDVMLNVGARFDDCVTGRTNAFSPNSRRFILILIRHQSIRIFRLICRSLGMPAVSLIC